LLGTIGGAFNTLEVVIVIIGGIMGFAITIGAAIAARSSAVTKRKDEIIAADKQLYDALSLRMAQLEAEVKVLRQEFAETIAAAVVAAIPTMLENTRRRQ
jgi:cell division protein FtsB